MTTPKQAKRSDSPEQAGPTVASANAIARICEGTWTSEPRAPIRAIRHRIDLIEDGLSNFLFVPQLFWSRKSSRSRLNTLAAYEAIGKGAVGIMVSDPPPNLAASIPCLVVDSPSAAIRRLAEHQRAQSRAKFFAVTGSVGKTTTKNMIYALTSAVGPAHRSIANYNKGLESIAFTLSSLSESHQYSAAEFNEVRDLDEQIQFFRPDVSVITNVLWEHIDVMERRGFSGPAAIQQLAHLAAGCARNMPAGGVCVLNSDEENFDIIKTEIEKSPHVSIRTFGTSASDDVRITKITSRSSGSDVEIEIGDRKLAYTLGLPGRHMAINSVAAATAVHFAGVDLTRVLHVFAAFEPEDRRGTRNILPWRGGSISIRDETFSSSIPSLRSSLQQLVEEPVSPGGRRIAILGQVGDLGLSMPRSIRDFAKEADALAIDRFYTVGDDIRILNETIEDRSRVAPHCQTLRQLELVLKQELRPGDSVLIKGSDDPNKDVSLWKFFDRFARTGAFPRDVAARKHTRRIVLGGDTYFGEAYQKRRVSRSKINYLEEFGYDYSGRVISPLFERADFALLNLECVLTNQDSSPNAGKRTYILGGDPARTTAALRRMNIGGVLLANNHTMDYAAEGLEETLRHLKEAGIETCGANVNRATAQRPILREFDVDGITFKLAIVAGYEYIEAEEDIDLYASPSTPGVNNINTDRISAQVDELRHQGYYVVASPHWGQNYGFRDYTQHRLTNRMVDVGVDLVLGHGPHLLNEIECIDGIWVVQSLGNLIFNAEGEYAKYNVSPFSMVAEIELSRKGMGVSGELNLYPIVSCNQLTQFQPAFVDEDQFEQVKGFICGASYHGPDVLRRIVCSQKDGRYCFSVPLF
jgi:UDP-N-acetylmuramoyl-tripeptide--D-alanyl-D-alanine ligase